MKVRGKSLNLEKSIRFLKKYGIPIVESKLAKTVDQATKAAQTIGYPVALKIVSSHILHKTDVGGVVLNINNKEELKAAYKRMMKNLRKSHMHPKIEGILIQRMVSGGQEVIIGGKKDSQFGDVILFGLGGIFAEVFNDVSFKIAPITNDDAEKMVNEIKGVIILKGYRGKKYNLKSLIKILVNVSRLLNENPRILEMDLNPVIVSNNSSSVVDARIIFS